MEEPSFHAPACFLALAQGFGAWFGVRQDHIRFAFALGIAIAVHAIAFGLLAFSISDQLELPEAIEPRFVSVVQPPPPPPDVRPDALLGDVDVVAPRFRPREPMGLTPDARQRFGDPALAVWKYLCNRDAAIGDAARKDCPAFALGGVDTSAREPLNRQGDVGVMFGAETATMSLEEAGRHKGWVRPKTALPADGARAKPDEFGLPGHDPFAILPGHSGGVPETKRD